jgi:hypothetical protein
MAEWLREVSVGNWYEANGEAFEIVGVDTKAEIVLVQHYDGSLDEFDFDSWSELEARPCAPPEDPSETSSLHEHSADPVGWLEAHGF